MYRAALALRPMARSAIMRAAPAPMARLAQPIAIRSYAAAAGLSKDQISERVLEVMKTFEKVDGGKVGLLVLGFVLGGVLCSRAWTEGLCTAGMQRNMERSVLADRAV